MPGKNQHEIPRLLQRGFLIPDTGKAERIFVFHKERGCYPRSIEGVGYGEHFYSEPNLTDISTLDDQITLYERNRLGPLLGQVRELPIGSSVAPQDAAEIVAHLTTRNAHLRGAMAYAFDSLAGTIADVLGDEGRLRGLLGIDTPGISDRFREKVVEQILSDSRMPDIGIPHTVLERMIYAATREDLAPNVVIQASQFQGMLQMLARQSTIEARRAHNDMLAKGLVPDKRTTSMETLSWSIERSASDLVLPDCVAIAQDSDEEWHPVMMAKLSNIRRVVMPLTSRTALVGTSRLGKPATLTAFNSIAAACSHSYFLSGSTDQVLVGLLSRIRSKSVQVIESSLNEAIIVLAPPQQQGTHDDLKQSETSQPIGFAAEFQGNFDEITARLIANATAKLVSEMAWTMPFDRVEAITFADDYPSALQTLDRGVLGGEPIEMRSEGDLIGVARCVNVLRDGTIRCHLVFHGNIGRALVSEDSYQRELSRATVATQFAHAGITQILDESLPGQLLKPIAGPMDSWLHNVIFGAWNGYFASRATARFGPDDLRREREVVKIALDEAFAAISLAVLRYREQGSLDDLMAVCAKRVGFLLEHVGNLLGRADGLSVPPLKEGDELSLDFTKRQLARWLYDFGRDLKWLWNRRGAWQSYEDFLALNRHVERLCWPFGVVPWTTSEGEFRIDFLLSPQVEATINEYAKEVPSSI